MNISEVIDAALEGTNSTVAGAGLLWNGELKGDSRQFTPILVRWCEACRI